MLRPFSTTLPDMLYVHWPFCASKCHYCDFVAMQDHQSFSQRYHEALCNEVRAFAQARPGSKKHKIKTIFFGGGTPSLYPLELLEAFFELLYETFDLSELQECSLEVNPDEESVAKLPVWRKLGINRLSVGVQVLSDTVLAKMNRHQKTEHVQAFFDAVEPFFPNVSADLIIGLPDVDDKIWFDTVDMVTMWPISHVSVYFLTVHEHTKLYHGVKAGAVTLPKDDAMLAQYEKTRNKLIDTGFEQYEISNFARPGWECIHNQGYWKQWTYQGFGLGAASYDGQCRYANTKKLTEYVDVYTSGDKRQPPHSYFEQLSDSQKQMEQIMLGSRQRDGVDLRSMVYLDNAAQKKTFLAVCTQLAEQGFIVQDESVIKLTKRGQIFENDVVVQLCRGLEGDHLAQKTMNAVNMNAD